MLTPAISASSTSDPWTIMAQAFCTQVTSPPFLNLLPLAEEITTGLAAGDAITAGASPNSERGAAAASPVPAPAMRKSRRFSFSLMGHSLPIVRPRDVRAGASVAAPAGGRPRRRLSLFPVRRPLPSWVQLRPQGAEAVPALGPGKSGADLASRETLWQSVLSTDLPLHSRSLSRRRPAAFA